MDASLCPGCRTYPEWKRVVRQVNILSLLQDIFQDPGESTSTLGGCCLLRLFVGSFNLVASVVVVVKDCCPKAGRVPRDAVSGGRAAENCLLPKERLEGHGCV